MPPAIIFTNYFPKWVASWSHTVFLCTCPRKPGASSAELFWGPSLGFKRKVKDPIPIDFISRAKDTICPTAVTRNAEDFCCRGGDQTIVYRILQTVAGGVGEVGWGWGEASNVKCKYALVAAILDFIPKISYPQPLVCCRSCMLSFARQEPTTARRPPRDWTYCTLLS